MAPKAAQPAKGSSLATKYKGKDSARKAGPKPPLGIPERLNRLFTSLCAQIDGGHFNNAIKTCDKSMIRVYIRFTLWFTDYLTSSSARAQRRGRS